MVAGLDAPPTVTGVPTGWEADVQPSVSVFPPRPRTVGDLAEVDVNGVEEHRWPCIGRLR